MLIVCLDEMPLFRFFYKWSEKKKILIPGGIVPSHSECCKATGAIHHLAPDLEIHNVKTEWEK